MNEIVKLNAKSITKFRRVSTINPLITAFQILEKTLVFKNESVKRLANINPILEKVQLNNYLLLNFHPKNIWKNILGW